MVDFRVVVSDTKSGKAYQVVASGSEVKKLVGKNIGDTVSGDVVGLSGYTLQLTGGTDKDGFAMRKDLPGPARRKILVAGGVGYKPKAKGVRKRKSMRGSEISSDISQVNAIIVEYGKKPLSKIFAEEGEGTEETREQPVAEQGKTEEIKGDSVTETDQTDESKTEGVEEASGEPAAEAIAEEPVEDKTETEGSEVAEQEKTAE